MSEKRDVCANCEGIGFYRGYTDRLLICDECLGSGRLVTLADRDLIDGILRAVRVRNELGWKP